MIIVNFDVIGRTIELKTPSKKPRPCPPNMVGQTGGPGESDPFFHSKYNYIDIDMFISQDFKFKQEITI